MYSKKLNGTFLTGKEVQESIEKVFAVMDKNEELLSDAESEELSACCGYPIVMGRCKNCKEND